jgi:hypothetical protein
LSEPAKLGVNASGRARDYNGVTSLHLLKPLIRQIKEISKAAIVVHRDRDYMEPAEIEFWKKEIIATGAQPFVTREIDVEGYFGPRRKSPHSRCTREASKSVGRL